jgi:hypothetical protein
VTARRTSVAPFHLPAVQLDDLHRRWLILGGRVRKLSALSPEECNLLMWQCVPDGTRRIAITYRIGEWDLYAIWYAVNEILASASTRGNLVLYMSREAAVQALRKEEGIVCKEENV